MNIVAEVKFYLALGLRWFWLFVLVAGAIGTLAVVVAYKLPTTYEASARLLVESEQIPGELAATTVRVGESEQLQVIQQRLMTRANLIEVAREFDVIDNIDRVSPDEVVDEMRGRTQFRTSSGRNEATLMTLVFTHGEARTTAAVVNEYVTRILSANVALRRNQAQDTLEFFEVQVDRLGEELDRQSERILAFKNENADALPDSLEYRLGRQSLLQERIAQIGRERTGLVEQRDRIVQVFEATGRITGAEGPDENPDERQLAQMRQDLAGLLAVYSEQNPQVRILRARIAALEERIAGAVVVESAAPAPEATLLEIQLAGIDARVEALEEQLAITEGELASVEDTIRRTPANAITLEALERDHANIQAQYNETVAGLAKAETGERIELLSKGQRITVIEQAAVPTKPAAPNRILIAGGGIVLGLGAGAGLVLLIVLLNPTVRRSADITRALGITPLGTLPYVQTRGEILRRRLMMLGVLGGGAAATAAALYVVETQVMPLVLIVDRLGATLGL